MLFFDTCLIPSKNYIAVFKFPDRKFKSVWWMPWYKVAMKDVAWLR